MKKRKVIAAIVISALIICFIAGIINLLFEEDPDRKVTEINDGWTVAYNGKTYNNVSILSGEIEKLLSTDPVRGRLLILKTTVPDIGDMTFPTLHMKTEHCAYKVYVGGERISDFAVNEFLNGKAVGSNDSFVLLPTDSAGETMTIMIYTCGDRQYTSPIQHPEIGERIDIEKSVIRKNILTIAVSCFLVIFGFVFAILTILLWTPTRVMLGQIMASVLMVDYGLYMLYYSGITYIFMPSSISNTGEFVSMYLFVPIALAMLYTIVKPTRKYITLTLATIIVSVVAVVIVLHLLGILYLDKVYGLFYIISMYLFIKLIYYRVYHIKSLELVPRLQLVALFGVNLFLMLNGIIQFLMIKRMIHAGIINEYLLAAGGAFFALLYLVTYLYYMTESYAQQAEYDYLSYLAYADSLTGLSNRFRCEKMMSDFVYEHPEADFCILSIDVNDLKKINDTFGHNEGDKYLIEFAGILKERFGKYGECGRFGGDEFVVFFERIDEQILKQLIEDMKTELNWRNLHSEKDIKYSVSYGYAYSHEVRIPSHRNVYMLADGRMYEQKREYHRRVDS